MRTLQALSHLLSDEKFRSARVDLADAYVRRARHCSRVCPQISMIEFSYGAGSEPRPRLIDPSFIATACDATFSGAMLWIISVHPRVSNAQSVAAIAPSVA